MTKTHIIRPLKQNAQPLPAFPDVPFKKSAEWDADIFEHAVCFKVTRRVGRAAFESQEFYDLLDAMRAAVYKKDGRLFRDPTAMVYVIASDTRSFCLAPKDWLAYATKWREKHGVQETR